MPSSVTPDLGNPKVLAQLFAPASLHKIIGLAVSGGADSLALMLLAEQWTRVTAAPPRIIIYSLDHGLRPEAREEVAMVVREAERLGFAARPLTWDAPKPTTGIQEAARAARYAIIGKAMAEDGATLLLTAHHRTDQAETILMRLAHGSGIEGLKGITPTSEVDGIALFRPLLEVDPKVLADLVAAAGLVPAQDPSNKDTHYERVRWRHLLPSLSAEGLDPAALSKFAARMAEADLALNDIANAAFAELVQFDGFGAASVPKEAFTKLSPAIGRRVLSRILNTVGGQQNPRALIQVETLFDNIVTGELNRAATVLGAVTRQRERTLIFSREPGRFLPPDQHLKPQSALIWDNRFRIANLSPHMTLTVSSRDFLPRHRIETVLGFKVTTPAEAIRTAPITRDTEGNVLSLGSWSFDDNVEVELLTK